MDVAHSPERLLGYLDVEKVLRRIGDAANSIVLIGGQALAVWDDVFKLSELPLTSKDIDFCGGRDAARLCALRLNGRARLPTPDEVTPNSAVVDFVDDEGVHRSIDFLEQPHGLDASNVLRLAQEIGVRNEHGADVGTFLVMHPLHCVISRASNTAFLPGYDSSHALEQLRISIRILRAFIERAVLEPSDPRLRDALDLIEGLYRFCHYKQAALEVYTRHQVDAFEAAPVGGFGLPEKYTTIRYPQMSEWLKRRRKRFASSSTHRPRSRHELRAPPKTAGES